MEDPEPLVSKPEVNTSAKEHLREQLEVLEKQFHVSGDLSK